MNAELVTAERAPSASRDPLLEIFTIKKLRFRNRIVSTSHVSMLDDGGLPLERYQRYHKEKARGGVAMTMVGGSGITSPDSSWGGGQLDLSSDRIIPHFAKLSSRIHDHGAAIMCQVSHLGRRASPYGSNWLPDVGALARKGDAKPELPKGSGCGRYRRLALARRAAPTADI